MHELALCDALLKMVRDISHEEALDGVRSITVRVRTLSGVPTRHVCARGASSWGSVAHHFGSASNASSCIAFKTAFHGATGALGDQHGLMQARVPVLPLCLRWIAGFCGAQVAADAGAVDLHHAGPAVSCSSVNVTRT